MSLPWAEKSIFARPFNFLRVRYRYAFKHIWLMPFIVAIPMLIGSIGGSVHSGQHMFHGLSGEIELIKIILPFTITSLAVVATFSGPESLDKPFKMASTVTLLTEYKGDLVNDDVTPRRFMGLLFSYVTMVSSLVLLLYFSVEPIAAVIPRFLEYLLSVAILFLMAQIFVLSAISVYLLGDYLARQRKL